jgi:hypothetical protein
MVHTHTRPRPHAEFRHRSQIPLPAVEEVEQRLAAWLILACWPRASWNGATPGSPSGLSVCGSAS